MFEPVLTMTDLWDGPRRGIAMYRGKRPFDDAWAI